MVKPERCWQFSGCAQHPAIDGTQYYLHKTYVLFVLRC